MQRARRYITVIVTLVLLIIGTFLALMLVRGNTFSISGGITETGTIRLEISPPTNFAVFLNEQRQNVTSNNTVDNVKPGEYTLKITKDQYTSWQQPIVVREGLVTDVSVRLFPESLKLTQITKTNISNVTYSQSRRYSFYVVKDSPLGGNVGIWRQTLVKSNIPLIEEQPVKITNLTQPILDALNSGTLRMIPSSNADRLLLEVSGSYYILDATRYNEPSEANQLVLSYRPDEIKWLKDANNLLIKSDNLLIDYDISSGRNTVITFQNDKQPIYTIQQGTVIHYINNKLYRYNNGSSTELELENVILPASIKALVGAENNDTNLLLVTETNVFFLYIPESYLGDLGKFNLITVSPTGRNLIVKDGEGQFQSIQVDISLTRNTVEVDTRVTTLPVTINTSSIRWDANSNFFVFKQSDITDKLYTADRRGNNINLVLLSENLSEDSVYTTTPDASSLIILLADDRTADADRRSNLYELNFVL